MSSYFLRIRTFFMRALLHPLEWIIVNFLGISLDRRNNIEYQNALRVQVKTGSNRTIPLVLNPEWTVRDIKNTLAAILDVKDPESLGIIFSGRELSNDVQVRQCDLGQQSILHAVQIVQKVNSKSPLNEELVDLQITGEDRQSDQKIKANFWVYCKDCSANSDVNISSLQPGKLRVRCHDCKETSILIHRDPCGWNDILEPGKIKGHCLNTSCTQKESTALAEFFFKCQNFHENDSIDYESPPPLHRIRSNIYDIPCLACTDDSIETVMVFDCPDQHVICVPCFEIFVKSRLNERQLTIDAETGYYTLGCPVGCENSLITHPKHFLAIISKEDYERYQRFATEECLLKSGGVLCPQPNCGTGILPDDPEERKIKCQQCDFVFCRLCSMGYHIGECTQEEEISEAIPTTSIVNSENISRARWQDQRSSLLTIKVMTKPCPKCRTPTERDGGCMHMECTRCNFQWCWLCQTTWTRECMASHWFH